MQTDLILSPADELAAGAPAQPQALDLAGLLENDPRLKSWHTRRGYQTDLEAFEAWRAGRVLSKLLVEQYAAELQAAGKAPSTINRVLAAVRWYSRRLADLLQDAPAQDDNERRQRAEMIALSERVASVSDVRGKRQTKGRHLAAGELGALLATCENDLTPAGARDAALVALAWATGARRAELAGLTLGDLTPAGEDEGELLIRGKGDKERVAYLYNGAYRALADWLLIRGSEPGPIFCRINKAGKLAPAEGLTGEAIRLILEKREAEAKVKPLTWHDFRRTFAGNLLDNGQDLVTVQKLMGHSDPATTSNYDRRGDEVKRKAVKTLHVPYRGRLV